VVAGPTALATVVAFVVGYGVIVAFLKLVSVRSYLVFVVYRVLLGLAVLAMLQLGVLSAI
jgi:undecaprenyl-diphosphatase